jgi:hypothetical protein
MSYATTPRRFSRKNSSSGQKLRTPSLVIHINKSGIVTTPLNDFTYRTEVYLQQREEQYVNKTPPLTITTWKNLKNQKRMVDNDQAEIDRVLSRIDSIHGTFNRSLSIPYNQLYSSLYGDDDKSTRLMKTFCQRQDHYSKEEDTNNNNTQETSSSFGFIQDTDSDLDNTEDEEEKKKSYDSGYGSVMPRRHFSRESLVEISSSSLL